MTDGQIIGSRSLKQFISKTAGKLSFSILGLPVHDPTNNFKLYKKSMLDNILIESKGGFEIALELTIKAYFNNYNVIEIPTIWINRQYGKSKFKMFKWLPYYLKWFIKGFQLRLKRKEI